MSKTIILDPGHGLNKENKYSRPLIKLKNNKAIIVPNSMFPSNLDKQPHLYREDIGVLVIAFYAQYKLQRLGYKACLTRIDERNAKIYLTEKLGVQDYQKNWKKWKWIQHFAQVQQSDAFVSIHTNAARGNWTIAFYRDHNGMKLGSELVEAISKRFGSRDRGVRHNSYAVLGKHSNGNACLLECLFHDNPDHLKILLDPLAPKLLGEVIAQTIHKNLSEE